MARTPTANLGQKGKLKLDAVRVVEQMKKDGFLITQWSHCPGLY
jgi:hypothetical protein